MKSESAQSASFPWEHKALLPVSLYKTTLYIFFHFLILTIRDHPNIHEKQRGNRSDCSSGAK